MTTYKLLDEADVERFAQVDAHAFNYPVNVAQFTPEARTRLRGLYENGRLVSQLQLLPLRVMTGTGEVACGGVASVATPPEHRRRGHTGTMLRHMCDELRETGTTLCMLYPFKRSFYGHFGWATFMERRVYSGSPELFARFKQESGHWERVGNDAIPELQRIYAGALRGRWGPLVRDNDWWERNVLRDWDNTVFNAFVWRDETGTGRGYVLYRFENRQEGGRRMSCREVIALDPVARAQIFAFLGNHDSQCQEVQFRAPADAPINFMLPDPLKCEAEPHFMLRLVDVAAALSAYAYPRDAAGRVTISVTDGWLTHNTGVYALEVADGVGDCTRLPDGSKADIACDVRVLIQLYTRYLRPRTAAAFGLLEAHSRPALALTDRLFTGLAPFNTDFF